MMNKIIMDALNEIGIKNYYLTRSNEEVPNVYVVFSHFSSPGCYADNKKGGEEYGILVNLYCKKNIESTKKLVIDALNKAGLKGGSCQTPFKEGNYYNTAINFKYFLR